MDQVGRVPLLTPAQEIELGSRVQRWLNHPDGRDGCPAAVQRSGRRARDQFVRANLRLAVSFVRKISRRYSASVHDDLIQAANEGLIRAVEKFDPTRGYKFSTYAYWWIRQAVTRWQELNGRVITIPALHSKHLAKIDAITAGLRRRLGRSPYPEEVADVLGVSMAVLEQVLINALPVASLDALMGHDDQRDLSAVIGTADPLVEVDGDRDAMHLRTLIGKLPQRDQRILGMVWGLECDQMPRSEVAASCGMTVKALDRHLSCLYRQLHAMAQPVMSPLPAPVRRRIVTDVNTEQLSLFCLGDPLPTGSGELLVPEVLA